MKQFDKTYKTPSELLEILKQRGLIIENEAKAENYLHNIGYYRLSAYMYPLLSVPKTNHQYKESASFRKVMYLYRFDKKLRILLFNEIEKIEIAFRARLVDIVTSKTNDILDIQTSTYPFQESGS